MRSCKKLFLTLGRNVHSTILFLTLIRTVHDWDEMYSPMIPQVFFLSGQGIFMAGININDIVPCFPSSGQVI